MKRALGVKREEDEERAARERALKSAKKTAEAMLKTLGEMKGLPLKLGQMASYIDGLAPPGYEDKFQPGPHGFDHAFYGLGGGMTTFPIPGSGFSS